MARVRKFKSESDPSPLPPSVSDEAPDIVDELEALVNENPGVSDEEIHASLSTPPSDSSILKTPLSEGPKPTLASVVREAIEQIGPGVTLNDVRNHIHRVGITDYKETTLAQTFSAAKRKLLGDSPRAHREVESSTSVPDVTDLLRIKEAAQHYGTLERLLEEIEYIAALAEKVGGISKLKSAASYYRKLLA